MLTPSRRHHQSPLHSATTFAIVSVQAPSQEYSCPVFLRPLSLTGSRTLSLSSPTLQAPLSPYPRAKPATTPFGYPSQPEKHAINPQAELSPPLSSSLSGSEDLLPTFTTTRAIRPSIIYRPILPSDYANLKAIHEALFPIK